MNRVVGTPYDPDREPVITDPARYIRQYGSLPEGVAVEDRRPDVGPPLLVLAEVFLAPAVQGNLSKDEVITQQTAA